MSTPPILGQSCTVDGPPPVPVNVAAVATDDGSGITCMQWDMPASACACEFNVTLFGRGADTNYRVGARAAFINMTDELRTYAIAHMSTPSSVWVSCLWLLMLL
jgi:hypothetical protein